MNTITETAYLKRDNLVVHGDLLGHGVRTNGGLVAQRELVSHISPHKRGLTDTGNAAQRS